MGDTTRNVGHLPGIQLERAPLGVIQRMTAKLKPDLVFIAAAMKSILLFFEIINIDAKLLAVVKYRSTRSALAGHAGKIIERA